jgi:hypothetical protein
MSLFTEIPSLEKLAFFGSESSASLGLVPDDSDKWAAHALSKAHQAMPFMSEYDVSVQMDRIDSEAGVGAGFLIVRNKTALRDPVLAVSQQQNFVRVPIVIQERHLRPFKVFEVGRRFYPLNKRRISRAMVSMNIFDGPATAPSNTKNLSMDSSPPYQQRQGYGRMADATMGTSMGKAASATKLAFPLPIMSSGAKKFSDMFQGSPFYEEARAMDVRDTLDRLRGAKENAADAAFYAGRAQLETEKAALEAQLCMFREQQEGVPAEETQAKLSSCEDSDEWIRQFEATPFHEKALLYRAKSADLDSQRPAGSPSDWREKEKQRTDLRAKLERWRYETMTGKPYPGIKALVDVKLVDEITAAQMMGGALEVVPEVGPEMAKSAAIHYNPHDAIRDLSGGTDSDVQAGSLGRDWMRKGRNIPEAKRTSLGNRIIQNLAVGVPIGAMVGGASGSLRAGLLGAAAATAGVSGIRELLGENRVSTANKNRARIFSELDRIESHPEWADRAGGDIIKDMRSNYKPELRRPKEHRRWTSLESPGTAESVVLSDRDRSNDLMRTNRALSALSGASRDVSKPERLPNVASVEGHALSSPGDVRKELSRMRNLQRRVEQDTGGAYDSEDHDELLGKRRKILSPLRRVWDTNYSESGVPGLRASVDAADTATNDRLSRFHTERSRKLADELRRARERERELEAERRRDRSRTDYDHWANKGGKYASRPWKRGHRNHGYDDDVIDMGRNGRPIPVGETESIAAALLSAPGAGTRAGHWAARFAPHGEREFAREAADVIGVPAHLLGSAAGYALDKAVGNSLYNALVPASLDSPAARGSQRILATLLGGRVGTAGGGALTGYATRLLPRKRE